MYKIMTLLPARHDTNELLFQCRVTILTKTPTWRMTRLQMELHVRKPCDKPLASGCKPCSENLLGTDMESGREKISRDGSMKSQGFYLTTTR